MPDELLLLALLAGLPWESKLAYPSATTTVLAIIRVSLPVLFLARAFIRRERLILPSFLWPLALFLLLTLLSLMLSPEPGEGIVKALRYLIFAASLFVAIQLLGERRRMLRAIRLLVLAAAAASVYALVGFLDGQLTRAAGPINDPNDFGFLLVAVIPLAAFLFAEERNRRALWGFALAALLAATLGTLSRGTLVGLGGLVVWALLTRRLSVVALLGAGAILATILLVGFVFFGTVLSARISGREKITSSSAAARTLFWKAAVGMTADHPLLGVGPERYDAERERYLRSSPVPLEHRISDQSQARDLVRTVHNSYLELAAENGIPAAMTFLLFLLAIWLALGNFARAAGAGPDEQGKRLAGALQGALITAVLSGFFLSGQLEPSFWLVAVLTGALTAALAPRPSKSSEYRARTLSTSYSLRFS